MIINEVNIRWFSSENKINICLKTDLRPGLNGLSELFL